jgi:rod shape-determining protein MreC
VWLLFALSLVALLAGGVRVCLRPAAREALSPYQRGLVYFRRHVVNRVAVSLSRFDLAERVAELQREVGRLRLVEGELERVAQENSRLRLMLALPPQPGFRTVACPVLERGGAVGWWGTLVIGSGADQGIAPGAPVVVAAGLVGRVTAVSAHTADVLLITDSNFRVACELETGRPELGGVRGVLSGAGGRSPGTRLLEMVYVADPLRLRYLRRDFEPSPRTRVVTSGLGGGFPRGLTVGHLLETRITADGLYREASVMPAADVGLLDEVIVLVREGGES